MDLQASNSIANILREIGNQRVHAPYTEVSFTSDPKVNRYLNNISTHPHAFVIACLLDRQVRTEKSWCMPYLFSQEIGPKFVHFEKLTIEQIEALLRKFKFGRYYTIFAKNVHDAIKRIRRTYSGNAALIWNDKPRSATLVKRFIQFDGFGPKLASMASNILHRDFKVPLADTIHIDISADSNVRRVFFRIGLVEKESSTNETILAGRELSPDYPGLIDLPAWETGRNICRPSKPRCFECSLDRHCIKRGLPLGH